MPRQGRRLIVILTGAFMLVWFMLPAVANAYPEPIGGASGEEPFSLYDCDICHATSGIDTPKDASGPHKHYATTTNKCALCHSVHQAPSPSVVMLQGSTVTQTCLMCHDGTGATIGVYTSIEAHAGVVRADHSCETTNVIPGGSTALGFNLNCSHCHSVHGVGTVEPFLRDSGAAAYGSGYMAADLYITSDCLLRADVNSGTTPEYGAAWCAACHDQRHSDSTTVKNHPVSADSDWVYRNVPSTLTVDTNHIGNPDTDGDGVADTSGEISGMGRTNSGYVMASVETTGDGRIELVDRKPPMCQQCHEDARNVEQVFSSDYSFRGTDPWNSPINPAFVTFPHQTTNAKMLVEEWDDLCLNCHSVSSLP